MYQYSPLEETWPYPCLHAFRCSQLEGLGCVDADQEYKDALAISLESKKEMAMEGPSKSTCRNVVVAVVLLSDFYTRFMLAPCVSRT